jgi:hypothetical protein
MAGTTRSRISFFMNRFRKPQWAGGGVCAGFLQRRDRSKCNLPSGIGFGKRRCRLECFSIRAKSPSIKSSGFTLETCICLFSSVENHL